MHELDMIVLAADLPEQGLQAGDIGTIVFEYDQREAFEVEFATLEGETLSVLTLPSHAVRPIREHEIAHARLVEAKT